MSQRRKTKRASSAPVLGSVVLVLVLRGHAQARAVVGLTRPPPLVLHLQGNGGEGRAGGARRGGRAERTAAAAAAAADIRRLLPCFAPFIPALCMGRRQAAAAAAPVRALPPPPPPTEHGAVQACMLPAGQRPRCTATSTPARRAQRRHERCAALSRPLAAAHLVAGEVCRAVGAVDEVSKSLRRLQRAGRSPNHLPFRPPHLHAELLSTLVTASGEGGGGSSIQGPGDAPSAAPHMPGGRTCSPHALLTSHGARRPPLAVLERRETGGGASLGGRARVAGPRVEGPLPRCTFPEALCSPSSSSNLIMSPGSEHRSAHSPPQGANTTVVCVVLGALQCCAAANGTCLHCTAAGSDRTA